MDEIAKLKEEFLHKLQKLASTFTKLISTDDGEWIVKGFIDVNKDIYTITSDTKVVSKVIELMLFPYFADFAKKNDLTLELPAKQNFYPDLTFIDKGGNKFAVDLKSCFRESDECVSTMTLGAFTGYFRERHSTNNTTYPYAQYTGHYVLGVIYTRSEEPIDAQLKKYKLGDLGAIKAVARSFEFFAQPKWRIAKATPGSGNTKNIGGIDNIKALIAGDGPFRKLGEDIFDDYWMYYQTKDMARQQDLEAPPYTNLESYAKYKNIKLPK